MASLWPAAGTGDGNGVIGVAPEAPSCSRSRSASASATVSSDDQIADGVRWAVDNGAEVINMSLTRNTLDWPESWDDAFLYAIQHDVVIVAAAGNRGSGTTEVGAPATMPGVLTVAGVDRNGKASFDASSQGITIGVSAPSEELVGATPAAVTCNGTAPAGRRRWWPGWSRWCARRIRNSTRPTSSTASSRRRAPGRLGAEPDLRTRALNATRR